VLGGRRGDGFIAAERDAHAIPSPSSVARASAQVSTL